MDLNGSFEFLATSINSDGNTYNLGNFPITFTETDVFNASGNGNLFVDFSSIGGSFGDSLTVTLAPSSSVVQFISPIGSVDLTLSYEASDSNSEKVPSRTHYRFSPRCWDGWCCSTSCQEFQKKLDT